MVLSKAPRVVSHVAGSCPEATLRSKCSIVISIIESNLSAVRSIAMTPSSGAAAAVPPPPAAAARAVLCAVLAIRVCPPSHPPPSIALPPSSSPFVISSKSLMPSTSNISGSSSPGTVPPSSSFASSVTTSTISSHRISTSTAIKWSTMLAKIPSLNAAPERASARQNKPRKYKQWVVRSLNLCGKLDASIGNNRCDEVGTSSTTLIKVESTSSCTAASPGVGAHF